MKILSLDLIAYGPFSGVEFDLSAGTEGLHILFGPNEAGKSSTLRALDALLFGMEARTVDAFRHPYDQLRVGGRLRTAAGEELRLIRRKGNKNTLRGADDTTVVEDTELERTLGGINRDTFRLMYGIDHDALVRGGRDILDQRGDVGQALFGTALGTAGLHRVLADLEAEAKGLFLPSGSKPAINRTLNDFREANRQIKEHSLKTSDWLDADRSCREAEAALEAVKADLSAARKRRSALERVRAVLPFAARRGALIDALTQAGDPVELPDSFEERWARARDARRTAQDTLGVRKPQLERLGAEIEGIVVPHGLLDQGETIEAFREGLGGYRNAERDLPACRIERDGALDRARRVLATVRPDLTLEGAESLRGLLAREATLRDRARQHSLIVQRAETAQSEARQATAEGNRCRAALAALPEFGDPTALRQAVDRAKRGGEIDAEIEQKARTVADRAADLARRLSALGLWSGTVESLAGAPLPQDATVDRFEKDLTDFDRRLERNRETLETAAEEETRFTRELEAIAATGAVPTEADLRSLRQRRQQGWALVRARWLEGVEAADEVSRYVCDGDLPGAYEAAVEAADEVSDRLRREARRVEQQAAALVGRDAAVRRRGELEAERTRLVAARSQAQAAWATAWAPCRIEPLGPTEMRGWLARAREILGRFDGLIQARGEMQILGEVRGALRADLGAALAARGAMPPGESERLAPLLAHAEAQLDGCDAVARDHAGWEKDLAVAMGRAEKAAADLRSARDERSSWRSGWTPLVADLGLPADAEPEEALGVLGRVR
ncbi:MAG: AAA family ATPase, partial [Deferrisomatales bacterium]|nr:AAA family ATPase [Deferrisomatales bacterium]